MASLLHRKPPVVPPNVVVLHLFECESGLGWPKEPVHLACGPGRSGPGMNNSVMARPLKPGRTEPLVLAYQAKFDPVRPRTLTLRAARPGLQKCFAGQPNPNFSSGPNKPDQAAHIYSSIAEW
ncbi:hypothetical protein PanWU01x14_333970 [Parasponia andersonii]|uniref:Uncharacterized protein n=1 Tax=Parasponia andersonii TaxID=3476 RepID=A0A2P5AGS4_PARAD|nr:hypothetical protein PanWU01x14_333970 [Parasponia andersonii]